MLLERKDYIIRTALDKVITIFNVTNVRNCRINHHDVDSGMSALFFNYEDPQSDLLMESRIVFGDYWFYNGYWAALSNKTEGTPDAEVDKLVPYNFSKDETTQTIARVAARIYGAFKYRNLLP